jgi:amino acid transporter
MSISGPRLPRFLGLFDLVMLLVVAIVNLNLVPVAAANGSTVLLLWILALLFFFIPQAIAVIELSKRYPREGGIYLWCKIYFGDFHGFLSGWCYWVNNIFYIPTLLFYLIGFSLFIFGEGAASLVDNNFYMTCSSIFLLWLFIGLHIKGAAIGKWMQNLGAIGVFLTVLIILGIAVITVSAQGWPSRMTQGEFLQGASAWRAVSVFGLLCFAFVGLELGSVMGDEIKEPQRNIPRAIVIAGICCAMLYVICTFALQVSLSMTDIGIISGILQAAERVAVNAKASELISPLALLLSLSICGAISAWISGSARLPFVMGIDRYLPSAFGRIHRRHGTPYVSLITQGIASSLVILLSSIGSNAREVYLILLNTAVIIQLIPFLYMFAALIKLGKGMETPKNDRGFPYRSRWLYLAGATGFSTTMLGVLLAFVPPGAVENILIYEIKIFTGCLIFIAPALLLFSRRNRNREAGIALSKALGDTSTQARESIVL